MSRCDQRTAAPGRTAVSLAWRGSGEHLPVLARPAQSLLLISHPAFGDPVFDHP
jgi:hypothetical protein